MLCRVNVAQNNLGGVHCLLRLGHTDLVKFYGRPVPIRHAAVGANLNSECYQRLTALPDLPDLALLRFA